MGQWTSTLSSEAELGLSFQLWPNLTMGKGVTSVQYAYRQRLILVYSHICYTVHWVNGISALAQVVFTYLLHWANGIPALAHLTYLHIYVVDTMCFRVPSSDIFQQFLMSSFSILSSGGYTGTNFPALA